MRRMCTAGFRIHHDLAVAVVSGDDHGATRGFEGGDHLCQPLIHRFTRLDRSIQITGMADHIGVCVIGYDQIVSSLDRLDEFRRDFGGGHFGLQIIGRNLGRFGHVTVFAFFRLLLAAIEKEGDMGVFFRLGEAELAFALFCDPFPQCVDNLTLGIGCVHIGIVTRRIFHHPQKPSQSRARAGFEFCEIRFANGPQNFPRPVCTEVQAEDAIAIANPLIAVDDRGLDEFIKLLAPIACLDRSNGGTGRELPLPLDHRLIGLADTFPSVVPVHGIVAARYSGNARAFCHFGFQLLKISQCRFRGHVPPVCHRMEPHRHARITDRLYRRQYVGHMAMYPPVGNKPHQMGRTTGCLELSDKSLQCLVVVKRSVLDREVNLPQIHRNHAASANIGVPNLRVAHLPAGQANIGTMGDQTCLRTLGHDGIEGWRIGQDRCVGRSHITAAPAVKNTQNNRFGDRHRYRLHFALVRVWPDCSGPSTDRVYCLLQLCRALGNSGRQPRPAARPCRMKKSPPPPDAGDTDKPLISK